MFFGLVKIDNHNKFSLFQALRSWYSAKRSEQKKKEVIFFSLSSFVPHFTLRTPETCYNKLSRV